AKRMRKVRVLLVDDDEEDFLLTRDYLSDVDGEPYELEWASSAEAARDAFRDNPPEVCLLDYRLGPDDGIALTAELVSQGFSGPVIMLTGQEDPTLDGRALASGAVDYLVKNAVSADQLDRAIRYGITRKQFEREQLDRIRAESRHRQAETENRLKSQFIAYISHELRTPLAAILGYSDLLAMHAEDGSPIADYAQAIARNGQHLNGLLNDILDLSKIEAGKLDLELEKVSTEQLVADIASTIRLDVSRSGLQFEVEVPQPVPEFLYTDARRLRQMLLNLLGNAIKYTDSGRIALRVLYEAGREQQIVFEIEDSGIGISRDKLDKIFDPFLQLNELRGASQGLGLGLAICRELATRLGGSINVDSELGKGSVFRLSIDPQCEVNLVQLDANRLRPTSSVREISTRVNGHVVIVDDSDEVRATMARVLEAHGARITALESGADLLRRAESLQRIEDCADVLLLDMQMPEVTGYEVVRRLRDLGFSRPVIAVTAAAMKGAREECLAAGCDDYLTKPVAAAQLIERVSGWLHAVDAALPAAVRVLIVDDSASASEALAALLRIQGAEVVTVTNAQACWQALESFTPDIVLLDFGLPDASGADLCRELRAAGVVPGARIFALTGLARADIDAADLEPFDEYVAKPVSVPALLALFNGPESGS
ncbi:MAG TPA: response regulator, partial [Gammaproteobacteria bacterium]|nr:response regulator [Gammaproteobacteria bacterium]